MEGWGYYNIIVKLEKEKYIGPYQTLPGRFGCWVAIFSPPRGFVVPPSEREP